jgi:hypothetical protein
MTTAPMLIKAKAKSTAAAAFKTVNSWTKELPSKKSHSYHTSLVKVCISVKKIDDSEWQY